MKTVKYFFEFLIIYLLLNIFKLIGYKNASSLGGKIGKIFGPLFRSKKTIKNNLNLLGISDSSSQKKIINNMWENYGRILSEYSYLDKFKSKEYEKFITIDGKEHLEEIKKSKKKVVFVSGHFNNFELMALQLENIGIDLAAIYRPLNNPFINKIIEKIRINYICKKQIKKGKSGSRKIVENLKFGTSIALMIDQRVTEGIKINFFNKPASTTTIPAQLVKKYNCPIVPVYIERINKIYFNIKVYKPLEFSEDKTIENISLELNKLLEEMVIQNPDQWILSHNRWK